ncbi:hypothetical protein [Micromonospora sp. WMMA1947]|uniref:hypothetical protein n=1 Tax=Micromonospora sp. WMMA1947 TaxID=3015163 RepID=UPI00248C774A|nr:hypothetical protein [Micromonospora sp. WMMA1947]WBC08378.1 hypothetical protein O7604_24550 [Micromonospora sp. WMMA1947]
MRPDEFRHALNLLPAALHARALPLRGYVLGADCADCLRIGDAVTLALTAAHYDEISSAGQLLDTATRLATAHGTACPSQPDQQRGPGPADRWAEAPAVATDHIWKGRSGGVAYVVSDGLRPHRRAGQPPLVRLAEQVRRRPGRSCDDSSTSRGTAAFLRDWHASLTR